MTTTTTAPAWFRTALEAPSTDETLTVEGAVLHYRRWGASDRPGVVLVHGGAAHRHWWDHVGPLLATDRQVVALDLSGHGDSERRPSYSREQWGREVLTLAARMPSGTAPPVLVGHSMGGKIVLHAAGRTGLRLGGVAALDVAVRTPPPQRVAENRERASRPNRVYATRDEAVRRFRPLPDDGEPQPWIGRHVAEHSVAAVAGGWSWKFDRQVFGLVTLRPDELRRPHCPVALIRAEHGMVPEDLHAAAAARLDALPVTVPDAGHHLMLDAPLPLVAALRTFLAHCDRADGSRV